MTISRRELLASIFGAPLALSACKAAPKLEGEIVGASDHLGHKLRELPPAVPQQLTRTGVLIVGAGVSGLSAGWRLRKAGYTDFKICELEREAGGTARGGRSSVTAYPWGAHYVPAPLADDRALITLFSEIGLLDGIDRDGEPVVAEQFRCRDPEERIFYRGRWYDGLYLRAGASPEDLRQLRAFTAAVDRWVAFRDAANRRAFTIPVSRCSADPRCTALDGISMSAWMSAQHLHSPRLRWLVDYACRDDYGASPDFTSAWAGIFYFASRQARAGQESRPLVTFPEGNGRLARHLYEQISDHVMVDTAVAEIIPAEHGSTIVTTSSNGTVHGYAADQVIFAAPQFIARHVLRSYRDAPPAHLAEFEYGAWMVANLHLRDRPREKSFPLSWDNVLHDSPSLGYVVATHQSDLDRGPTVFTYYRPFTDEDPKLGRQKLLASNWQTLADETLSDLARVHPDLRALTSRIDIMRWGHAMIRPRVGFLFGGARLTAQRPHRGVHFAHSDLSGVALFEEAFDNGLRAAEEVLYARNVVTDTMR